MFAEDYSSPVIHRRMLQDKLRCEAYRKAIFDTVKPGDLVADVGAGTGVLSVFAAQAGARRVYAVESSKIVSVLRRVLADNGVAGRVHIIHGDMARVTLPEPVDVMLSEWIGSYGDSENLFRSVLAARERWLKPGGSLLPYRVTTWLAPAFDEKLEHDMRFWRETPYGIELRTLAELKVHEPLLLDYPLSREVLVAAPQKVWSIHADQSTASTTPLPFRAALQFSVERPGTANALVAWFDAEVAPGIPLTNAPGAPRTHWRLAEFPLQRAIKVKAHTVLAVDFAIEPSALGACHVRWSVDDGMGRRERQDTRTLAAILNRRSCRDQLE